MRPQNPRRYDPALDRIARALLWLLMRLPYRLRVTAMSRITRHLVAPLLGWRRRIRANLAHARPDLASADIARLCRTVPENAGRTLIEIYSAPDLIHHTRDTPLGGDGTSALLDAVTKERPVILVSAHLGNFDVIRTVLNHHGITIAGLYRPMRNAAFNAHYARALGDVAQPIYPTDRAGLARFVRHLAGGGVVGMLNDVYAAPSPDVTFFGRPAPTSPAAATWALRYDALLIPAFGIRLPDGHRFDVHLGAPIAHTNARQMTQEINDAIERAVEQHMDQWFWIHRRWKPESDATRKIAAALGSHGAP